MASSRKFRPQFQVYVDTDASPAPSTSTTTSTSAKRSALADKENAGCSRPPPSSWNGKAPFSLASPDTKSSKSSSSSSSTTKKALQPLRANAMGRKKVVRKGKGKAVEMMQDEVEMIEEVPVEPLANVTEAYTGQGGFHYSPKATSASTFASRKSSRSSLRSHSSSAHLHPSHDFQNLQLA